MNNFIEVIKQVAVNAVESGKPVNILYGNVVSVAPLKIKISQQQILTKEFFTAVEPKPTFIAGEKLVLVRVQGGQRYLILGKGVDL